MSEPKRIPITVLSANLHGPIIPAKAGYRIIVVSWQPLNAYYERVDSPMPTDPSPSGRRFSAEDLP
jgi:hypothetical protein